MKRFLWILMVFSLFLTGCGKQATTQTPDALSAAILEHLPDMKFTPCDGDYVENGFDFAEFPTAYALCFGEEFGMEIGVFSFENQGAAWAGAEAVKAYLAREEQAVRDLSALYPANELTARLSRYQSATVHVRGNTVAYFLLPDTARTTAETAFLQAVKEKSRPLGGRRAGGELVG